MKGSIAMIGVILLATVILFIAFGEPLQEYITNSTQHGVKRIDCQTSRSYVNLSKFDFSPRKVVFEDTACLSERMFKEMGFIDEFNIPLDTFRRFIHQVQNGYRPIPYHNWHHGFAVLHFSFLVLKNCKFIERRYLRSLEGLALMTAAMCHDIDHPGTSSRYQEEVNSTLAQKYREQGSILERHHIEKTYDILEQTDTNFVEHLSPDDNMKFMNLIKQIILATDLNRHFKTLPEEQTMAMEGYDLNNEKDHQLLMSTIITSADLSDPTKDWATTLNSSKSLNMEFFAQGDKEKAMGLVPLKMMDRTYAKIAEEAAKFISEAIMPAYRVLATMCPEVKVCLDSLERNEKNWQEAIPYFQQQSQLNRSQLEIIDDSALDQIPHDTMEEKCGSEKCTNDLKINHR